jgi:hypothetical protein
MSHLPQIEAARHVRLGGTADFGFSPRQARRGGKLKR